MRRSVSRNRIRRLAMVSSVAILGGAIAGCSSGFQRFDDEFYQSALPKDVVASQNSQHDNIDPTTTASINRKIVPQGDVAPAPVPQGVYHQPEPTFAAPPNYDNQIAARQPLNTYKPQPLPQPQSTGFLGEPAPAPVTAQSLPKVQPTSIASQATYTPPKPDRAERLAAAVIAKPAHRNPIKTAALANDAPEKVNRDDGWTKTGGTTIVVRQGETLYNLSKRYGVPVSEIRRANGMSQSAELKSEQRLIIPNYVFTPTAAVSAPDNDPKTKAARSTTGFNGEVAASKAIIPTKRPSQQ